MVSKPLSEGDKEAAVPLRDLSAIENQNRNVGSEDYDYDPRQTPLPSTEIVVTIKSGWRRYCGLVFALLCSLFFSGTVLIAKVLHQSHGHHPLVVTMYRYGCGIFLPSIPVVIYFQKYAGVQVFETLLPITANGH